MLYAINDTTLEAMGNAIRSKKGGTALLTTTQIISAIYSLSDLSGTKEILTPLLPRFHFSLMNAAQFEYTVKRIITAAATVSNNSRLVIENSFVELDEDENLSLDGNGMPIMFFVCQTLLTQVGAQQMAEQAAQNAMTPTVNMLGEIFIGDDENE